MKNVFYRLMQFSQRHREGAATLEFTVVLPLFFLLCLVIWAVDRCRNGCDGHSGCTSRCSEVGGYHWGHEESNRVVPLFGPSNQYELSSFKVEIKNNKVHASAKTKIPVLFMSSSPFTYDNTAEAPVVKSNEVSLMAGPGMGIAGPSLASVGGKARTTSSKYGYNI